MLFSRISVILMILFEFYFTLCKDKNLKNKITGEDKLSKTISYIYKNLAKTQCDKEIRFRNFPPRLGENKGLYRSYIHLNVMDKYNSELTKLFRLYSKVTDMNMFVTNFVVLALLETYEYEGIDKLDLESLENALNALLDFKDKNYEESVPIYTFWKQINVSGVWSENPENMCSIIGSVPTIPDSLISTLNKLGLKELAKKLFEFKSLASAFLYAYKIPSDTDDTSVNLALSGIIHKMKNTLGDKVSNIWLDNNKDFKALFSYLKYFSYRPFSTENEDHKFSNSSNIIDARTYFVIHDFLKDQQMVLNITELSDLILPTTWIFDINLQKSFYPHRIMPFSVNNVDFNVAANFLFGVTNIVLHHSDPNYITDAFDSEIKKMYMSTVDLIVYAIRRNIIDKRPDLAFLYYPSIFDFYWLASRTYSTLNNFNISLLNSELKLFFMHAKNKLEDVLKNEATEQILNKMKIDKDGDNYFMEFLGNHANYTRAEDTMFATGLALNSLLNIWTENKINNVTNKLELRLSRPLRNETNGLHLDVNQAIHKLANYIIKSFDSYFLSLEGAFFSGSVKTNATFPFFFPSNYNRYSNGTDVDDINDINKINFDLTSGVKGYIDDEVYNKMIEQDFYGEKVTKDFIDLNEATFPFWSSPAITYSINLLGLSKYRKLVEN